MIVAHITIETASISDELGPLILCETLDFGKGGILELLKVLVGEVSLEDAEESR